MNTTISQAHFNPTTKKYKKILLPVDEVEWITGPRSIRAITLFDRRYTTALAKINWEPNQYRVAVGKAILEKIFSDNPGLERKVDALASHESLPIGSLKIEFN